MPHSSIWPKALVFLVLLAAIAGGAWWYWQGSKPSSPTLRTAAVMRGDIIATVNATGTIEPEEIVDVGAQVVGIIKGFGRDLQDSSRRIDFLSAVEEGTILARIDDSVYRARLDKAAAAVEQARAQAAQQEANLRRSEADVVQMKAKSLQADHDWTRAEKLLPSKSISQAEIDATRAAFEVARANVAVAEAAVDQARATKLLAERTVALAQADEREAQQNLDYTVIRSPVRGVIVDRRVNVGQTVISSLNAPSLFLIAKDLQRLQAWASVNEADIGRISKGQSSRFSVDTYPAETFQGTVSQVRLNATMTQNVVTYTVVVDVENHNSRLLPYLTANLHFEVGRREHVLLVPNAALRWQPQPQWFAHDTKPERAAKKGATSPPLAKDNKLHDRGKVWVQERELIQPVEVRIGLTDGLFTEVLAGDLKEDQLLVVGEETPTEATVSASPFTPRFFGGGQR